MTRVLHASTDRHEYWGGPCRYVRIYVHDTLEEMRKAACLYSGSSDSADAEACYQGPWFREKFDEEKQQWVSLSSSYWAGIIRMHGKRVETEILVHECLHAALAIYRMDVLKMVNLGEDCESQEEILCYIHGDLTASVSNALHRADLWSK